MPEQKSNVVPFAPKLDAKAAADRDCHRAFREALAASGFDPAMADWAFTWVEDASGKIVPGSAGIIKGAPHA